jgi:hypothetical protein
MSVSNWSVREVQYRRRPRDGGGEYIAHYSDISSNTTYCRRMSVRELDRLIEKNREKHFQCSTEEIPISLHRKHNLGSRGL